MAATATTTSTDKGRRIVGAERQTLAKDLVKRYTSGESIRALASSTGRSYGFVHRVTTDSPDIRLDSDGPVATVTLSRPQVLNAQTPLMWERLREIGHDLPGDI